jgi:glycosyltransferase involved in cell wall biosynthesis
MQIGIDAKRAAFNKVGLGSYSRNLIQNLARFYPIHQYYLYTPRPFMEAYRKILGSKNVHARHPAKELNRLGQWWWLAQHLPRLVADDKVQLFHGLSHTLPSGLKCPTVVTMHDLIFLRHPEWFRWHDRLSYASRFKSAALRSDKIIAISETTKKDLIDFYGVPESKIHVTYQPCNENFRPLDLSDDEILAVQKKYNLPSRFIVCVGTVEPRKNALSVAKAFHNLGAANRDWALVIVGKQTSYAKEIQGFISEKGISNIKLVPFVEFDDLVKILNMAKLSVYLPFFEGFGLPVLESMQCGTPVLTSNVSSLPEVGGKDSAFYADPSNMESIVESLRAALTDTARYNMVKSNIGRQVELFTPQKTTQAVVDVYKTVVT